MRCSFTRRQSKQIGWNAHHRLPAPSTSWSPCPWGTPPHSPQQPHSQSWRPYSFPRHSTIHFGPTKTTFARACRCSCASWSKDVMRIWRLPSLSRSVSAVSRVPRRSIILNVGTGTSTALPPTIPLAGGFPLTPAHFTAKRQPLDPPNDASDDPFLLRYRPKRTLRPTSGRPRVPGRARV